MNDDLELRLRIRLHSAPLPAAPERLREWVRALPRTNVSRAESSSRSVLLLAASVGLLLVLALAIFAVGARPAPVDDPEQLLRDVPSATVVLTHSVGTADAPISEETTPRRTDLGPVDLDSAFVIAVSCLGPGQLMVQVGADYAVPVAVPSGEPLPSPSAQPTQPGLMNVSVECNGEAEYADTAGPFAATGRHPIYVTAATGASWRIAVGVYPQEFANRPAVMGSLTPSNGWSVLVDFYPMLVTPYVDAPVGRTGVAIRAPADATRAGVIVWCSGDATLTVTGSPAPSEIAPEPAARTEAAIECPSEDTGRRIEFAVTSGEAMYVLAEADGPLWVRLLVEVDAELVNAYPTAPPLPADVADSAYAGTEISMGDIRRLAAGRLGSNRQRIVEAPTAFMASARGDHLLVHAGTTSVHRLELWNVDGTEYVRTLAELDPPAELGEAWLDVLHEQVFYLAWSADGTELRRVGLDGSDDRVLATVSADGPYSGAELALDSSVFVLDRCTSADGCSRVIIDAATLGITTLKLSDDGWRSCNLLGVADGMVLAQCGQGETPWLIATSLDGTAERELARGNVTDALLVRSDRGPYAVYALATTPAGTSWVAVDVASGEARTLITFGAEAAEAGLLPADVALPPNWLLMATDLGDFPRVQFSRRPVPLLLNVLTGERIVLVNMPHFPVDE